MKHLSNIDNSGLYLIFFIAYGFAISNRGLLSATDIFIFVIYTFGGAILFVDIALILKGVKYKLTFLKAIGYLIILIYPSIKLYIGVNNYLILLTPLYFGIIFFLIVLFAFSDTYRKINIFESKLDDKIKNYFKNKHNK